MLKLPQRFISFWYPDSLEVFLRVWSNLISILEEDLAVGLMFKLLFIPLFHDSTIVGKILSFLFRLSRILIGLLAFLTATAACFIFGLIWFSLPFLILITLGKPIFILPLTIFFIGFGIFVDNIFNNPPKKTFQIKSASQLFQSSKLTRKDLTWSKLIEYGEVKNLLSSLEISKHHFTDQKILIDESFLQQVLKLAKKFSARFVTAEYFWLISLFTLPGIDSELLKLELVRDDFEAALYFQELKKAKWRKVFIWDEDFSIKHLKGTNRGWLSIPTPNLDKISTDLTKIASKNSLEDFYGRQVAVSNTVNILSQSKDRNVLIVGDSGAGKSTLVNHLAKLIISGDAPGALASKRLVSLDVNKLISGILTEGDLAEKLENAFQEVEYVEDIIIFVDEIQTLGVGQTSTEFNLYSLLIPYLESDKFQFIATTDPLSYEQIIEKNTSFARIFNKVELPPASILETIEILERKAVEIARFKKINLTYIAIKNLVELSGQYIKNRVLPESSLSTLELCISQVRVGEITSSQIKKTFEQISNVPIELDVFHQNLLLNLEDLIHQNLVDQNEAVNAVSNVLRRSATELREKTRPIGSFLFVGPTGVGKTKLAKILSKLYFNSLDYLRFDMSEYQSTQGIDKLLGSSATPGELTEAVEHRPYRLILLDEFEKASHVVLNLFLQIFEDGILTDYSGKHVDFTNTIIIATSNVASLTVAKMLKNGQSTEQIEPLVQQELLKVFSPELINRFDKVIIFKTLTSEDLKNIVKLKLQELDQTLKNQGYKASFKEDLIDKLTIQGFDPILGARPLRRLIQDKIEAKLSRLILEKKLKKGEEYQIDLSFLS